LLLRLGKIWWALGLLRMAESRLMQQHPRLLSRRQKWESNGCGRIAKCVEAVSVNTCEADEDAVELFSAHALDRIPPYALDAANDAHEFLPIVQERLIVFKSLFDNIRLRASDERQHLVAFLDRDPELAQRNLKVPNKSLPVPFIYAHPFMRDLHAAAGIIKWAAGRGAEKVDQELLFPPQAILSPVLPEAAELRVSLKSLQERFSDRGDRVVTTEPQVERFRHLLPLAKKLGLGPALALFIVQIGSANNRRYLSNREDRVELSAAFGRKQSSKQGQGAARAAPRTSRA
jgi:hypothetical protein